MDKTSFIKQKNEERTLQYEGTKELFGKAQLDILFGNFFKSNDPLLCINEIIQNADDCNYKGETPEFKIDFGDPSSNTITITYNEVGMNESNIKAITSFGISDKVNKDGDDGDIQTGEKGIGFKTIFGICDTVDIFSNGYQFTLSGDTHGFIPVWVDAPSGIDSSKGTTLVLHLSGKSDESKSEVYERLKKLYTGSVDDCPIIFTKKLKEISAKIGVDKADSFSCSVNGNNGLSDDGNRKDTDKKDIELELNISISGEEQRTYPLCGISKCVQISKEAVNERYKIEEPRFRNVCILTIVIPTKHFRIKNKQILTKPLSKPNYRMKLAKFNWGGNIIGEKGRVYSYLPTQEKLSAPIIMHLPVELSNDRTQIAINEEYNDTSMSLWNNDVFSQLPGIIEEFYKFLSEKFDDDKLDKKQFWKYMPKFKGDNVRFFERIFLNKRDILNNGFGLKEMFNKIPCFVPYCGEKMVCRNDAVMLQDNVLINKKIFEAYCTLYGDDLKSRCLAYHEKKKNIVKPLDIDDEKKKKILNKLADTDDNCKNILFNYWNGKERTSYFPDKNDDIVWKYLPIFPANTPDRIEYKSFYDGNWLWTTELTSPSDYFFHFYKTEGETPNRMANSIAGCNHKPFTLKTDVFDNYFFKNVKDGIFPLNRKQLTQIISWCFNPEDGCYEFCKKKLIEKTDDTDHIRDIIAKCDKENKENNLSLTVLKVLALYQKAKFDNLPIILPEFKDWNNDLREALNLFKFDTKSRNTTNDKLKISEAVKDEDLQKSLEDNYSISTNVYFYGNMKIDEKSVKYARFEHTVVFFDKSKETIDFFLSSVLKGLSLRPQILDSFEPFKTNDNSKKLLRAITDMCYFSWWYNIDMGKSLDQINNDFINEILQNINDSKHRNSNMLPEKINKLYFDVKLDTIEDCIKLSYSEAGFSLRDFFCISARGWTGNENCADTSTGHFGTGFRSVYKDFKKVVIKSKGVTCLLDTESVPVYDDKGEFQYGVENSSKYPEDKAALLEHHPIPVFIVNDDPGDNITTMCFYFRDDKKDKNYYEDRFTEASRLVFLDELHENSLAEYSSKLGEISAKDAHKNRIQIPPVTIRLPQVLPENPIPLYCTLPMSNTSSLFRCYVNIPAIEPNDDRRGYYTNTDGSGDIRNWNTTVINNAYSEVLPKLFGDFASDYYGISSAERMAEPIDKNIVSAPYEYLTNGLFSLYPNWEKTKLFPSNQGSLCSIEDIRTGQVYLLPKGFWNLNIPHSQIDIDKPYISDKEVSEFIYSILGENGNIPAQEMLAIIYGKDVRYYYLYHDYRNNLQLPENMQDKLKRKNWFNLESVQAELKDYSISLDASDCKQICVNYIYEDLKFEDMRFAETVFSIIKENPIYCTENVFKFTETPPKEDKQTVIENRWFLIKRCFNNTYELYDKNKLYLLAPENNNDTGYKYLVNLPAWMKESPLPGNLIKPSADALKSIPDNPSKDMEDFYKQLLTLLLKQQNGNVEEADMKEKYKFLLKTYCDYYNEIGKTGGFQFEFKNTISLGEADSGNQIKSKFEATVDEEKIKWETLKDCSVYKIEYEGYVCHGNKIILLCSNYNNSLKKALRKLLKNCYNIDAAFAAKRFKRMISRPTAILFGGYDDKDADISDILSKLSEENEQSIAEIKHLIDNMLESRTQETIKERLSESWSVQVNGQWMDFRGYGAKSKKSFPKCPICGSKIIAHSSASKIECIPFEKNGALTQVPVLMCGNCSKSIEYANSVTIMEKGSNTDGSSNNELKNPLVIKYVFFDGTTAEFEFNATVYHCVLIKLALNKKKGL